MSPFSRVGPMLLALLLASCASGEPVPGGDARPEAPAHAEPSAPTGDFTFDWSPPCRVPVLDRTQKRGHEAVMSYSIEVVPSQDESLLEVRMVDLAFVSLDGMDAKRPDLAKAIAQAEQSAKLLPAMLVTRAGEFQGTTGLEEVIDAVVRDGGGDEEEQRKTREFMMSPDIQATLEQTVGDYWRTWVEVWIGWSIPEGESESGTGTVDKPLGAHAASFRAERLPDVDGFAVLRFSTQTDEASARALVRNMMAQSEASEVQLDEMMAEIDHVGVEHVLYVETDPATLRPRLTRAEKRVEVSGGGASRSEVEVRELTWDWRAAEGCGER